MCLTGAALICVGDGNFCGLNFYCVCSRVFFWCAKDLISNMPGQIQRVPQMNGLTLVNRVFLNQKEEARRS